MKFDRKKSKVFVVAITLLLFEGLSLVVFTANPVHAFSPAVTSCHAGSGSVAGSLSCGTLGTVTTGNLLTVEVGVIGTGGSLETISVTDTLSTSFTCVQFSINVGSQASPDYVWAAMCNGIATATGADTPTCAWTVNNGGNNCAAQQWANLQIAQQSGTVQGTGTQVTVTSLGLQATGQNNIVGVDLWNNQANPTFGNAYTGAQDQNPGYWGAAFVSSTADPTIAFSGTNSVVFDAYFLQLSTSANGIATTTTTVNTLVAGASSGGNNGTAVYTASNSLYFYTAQNTASPGQIDNVSLKVSAVHINSATGLLYLLVYSSGTSPPSASNPYTLITNSQLAQTVTNGTSPGYIHWSPGAIIGAGAYFAVGVMATTTKSNSATVTGSGISLLETSQAGITEYQFAVGSSTPANSFYSNTVKANHHFDWIYIHETYTIATITTTTTLPAVTLSGTVSVTTTITSTTLDANLSTQSMTGYVIELLVILVPALAIGGVIAFTTKSFPGFAVGFITGAAIGTGLGVQASLVTPQFEALAAIAMVFMAVMAFVTSQRGGGMG